MNDGSGKVKVAKAEHPVGNDQAAAQTEEKAGSAEGWRAHDGWVDRRRRTAVVRSLPRHQPHRLALALAFAVPAPDGGGCGESRH